MLISKLISSFKGCLYGIHIFSKKKTDNINRQSINLNNHNESKDEMQNFDSDYLRKINQATDIQHLIDLQRPIFYEKRFYLPSYLYRISQLMNIQQYDKYKRFLNQVYYKTRKTSSESNLTTQQLLKILIFSQQINKYSKQFNKIGGFQIRMSFLTAQILLSKKVTVLEAITLFSLLNSHGHKSLQCVQNLTIFLKNELKKDYSLKIQQFLSVLKIYSQHKHKSAIQNVLADQILSSIKLQSIQECDSLTLLIENLRLFNSLSIWRFYKTDLEKILLILQTTIKKVLSFAQKTLAPQLMGKKLIIVIESLTKISQLFNYDKEVREDCSKLRNILYKNFILKNLNNLVQIQRFFFNLLFAEKLPKQVNQYFQIQLNFIKNSKKFFTEQFNEQQQLFYIVQKLKRNRNQLLLFNISSYQGALRVSNQINLSITHYLIKKMQKRHKYQFLSHIQMQIIGANDDQEGRINELIKLSYLTIIAQGLDQPKQYAQLKFITNNSIQKQFLIEKNVRKLIEILLALAKQLNNLNYLLSLVQSYSIIWNSIQKHPINDFQDKQFEIKYLQFLFITSCSQDQHISQRSTKLLLSLPFNQFTFYQFLASLSLNSSIKINHQPYQASIMSLRFVNASKKLLQISTKDRFCYHVWEIIIGNYLAQPKQIKLVAYDILKESFLKALAKQTARKVVLMTYFTNLIAQGLIEISPQKLKILFQQGLALVINTQKAFHYHCYLRIVKNALLTDNLSFQSFESIIRIGKTKSKNQLFDNCLLLLFFSMHLKVNSSKSNLISQDVIKNQLDFLKKMLKSLKFNKNAQGYRLNKQSVEQYIIQATAPYIAVLLLSGLPQILPYAQQISQFIKNCRIYLQFKIMLKAYLINGLNTSTQYQKINDSKLNESFANKIDVFFDCGIDKEFLIASKQKLKSFDTYNIK